MSTSMRQDIMDALKTLLASVSEVKTCDTWKKEPLDILNADPAVTPAILIRDKGEQISPSTLGSPSRGKWRHELQVEILILCQGSNCEADVREYLRLLWAQLLTDPKLGNKVDQVINISDEMEVVQEAKAYATVLVRMSFTYDKLAFTF